MKPEGAKIYNASGFARRGTNANPTHVTFGRPVCNVPGLARRKTNTNRKRVAFGRRVCNPPRLAKANANRKRVASLAISFVNRRDGPDRKQTPIATGACGHQTCDTPRLARPKTSANLKRAAFGHLTCKNAATDPTENKRQS